MYFYNIEEQKMIDQNVMFQARKYLEIDEEELKTIFNDTIAVISNRDSKKKSGEKIRWAHQPKITRPSHKGIYVYFNTVTYFSELKCWYPWMGLDVNLTTGL